MVTPFGYCAHVARVQINPTVLAWAMSESGATPRQLAEVTHRDVGVVDAWLQGKEFPHGGDVQKLSIFLSRPRQFFFLPRPPDKSKSKVNRRAALVDTSDATPEELAAVRSVARLQTISRWSLEQLDEEPIAFPSRGHQSPERYAETVRTWLGWDISKQVKAGSKSRVFRDLRQAVEDAGALVFLRRLGETNSRGFSLPDDYVPAICVNASFTLGSVRSYTLLHELAHLARGDAVLHHEQDSAAERWCERFAAAFLIPSADLQDYLSKGRVAKTGPDDIDRVRLVSNRYGASWESVAWRLVELRLAPKSLITKIKQNQEPKDGGFNPDADPRTTSVHRLDEFGREFSRLIISAMGDEHLSALDAKKYLRVDSRQLSEMANLLGLSA